MDYVYCGADTIGPPTDDLLSMWLWKSKFQIPSNFNLMLFL